MKLIYYLYVPTKEAVKGKHYSAIVQSNLVGHEGGQILVDRTVERKQTLYPILDFRQDFLSTGEVTGLKIYLRNPDH